MKATNTLLTTAIFIVFLSPVLTAKEKPGADIVVMLNDGRRLHGELIAVKKDSLLLLAGGASMETAQALTWDAIAEVAVVRKSRLGEGSLIGGLIGGAGGFLIGYSGGDDPPGWFSFTAGQKGVCGAVFLGLVGVVIGGVGGALSGADISLPVDATSGASLRRVRDELARRARIKGIQ